MSLTNEPGILYVPHDLRTGFNFHAETRIRITGENACDLHDSNSWVQRSKTNPRHCCKYVCSEVACDQNETLNYVLPFQPVIKVLFRIVFYYLRMVFSSDSSNKVLVRHSIQGGTSGHCWQSVYCTFGCISRIYAVIYSIGHLVHSKYLKENYRYRIQQIQWKKIMIYTIRDKK